MNEHGTIPTSYLAFKDFLFTVKINKRILLFAFVAALIQFSIFKYFYPQANFIHSDSFSYLNAADKNVSVNMYLIGYSNFLRLFSVFSKSDLFLTAFQYFLLQASTLTLLFTIFYFYKPGKVTQLILLAFMVFNPLFLYLGNLISSDGYFLALSFLWISLLIWIIQRPSWLIIGLHAIVSLLAFTTRYNSILYPLISAGVFLGLSTMTVRQKITGLGISLLFCLSFIAYTSFQYKKLTGYWQYSPFSGWQLANNAMYSYRYVDSKDRVPVPQKFYMLDKMIREFFDSTRDVRRFPTEALQASTFYMWMPQMPLMKYQNMVHKKDTAANELTKWASMGPFYKEYGMYIIKQYPYQFLRYFAWPNSGKYYAPPVEYLQVYNSGNDSVPDIAKAWFGYQSRELVTRLYDKDVLALNFYPALSGLINIAMLCSIICFLLLKGWQYNKAFNKLLLLGTAIWMLNAGFTILASSAALRFQAFPILLTTIMSGLFIDWMVNLMQLIKQEEATNKKETKQTLIAAEIVK